MTADSTITAAAECLREVPADPLEFMACEWAFPDYFSAYSACRKRKESTDEKTTD